MAHCHVKSGALVGIGVADITHTSLPVTIVTTILAMGAALLPDWDHPQATAAHTFGPVSKWLAEGVNRLGVIVHSATRTRYDRPTRDGHRTITHVGGFAVLAGAGTVVVCTVAGRWGMLATLFVLMSLAVRGSFAVPEHAGNGPLRRMFYRRRVNAVSITVIAFILTGLAYFLVPQVNPVLIGTCVALGCVSHCLGDSCTMDGCPLLWPLRVRGQRWYPVRTPRVLRFRTGQARGTEKRTGEDRFNTAMSVALVLLVVTMVPHSWATVGHAAHGALAALTR